MFGQPLLISKGGILKVDYDLHDDHDDNNDLILACSQDSVLVSISPRAGDCIQDICVSLSP